MGTLNRKTHHVPGELHQGTSQQEGVIDLLPVEVREDCGQARADVVDHHVLSDQTNTLKKEVVKICQRAMLRL